MVPALYLAVSYWRLLVLRHPFPLLAPASDTQIELLLWVCSSLDDHTPEPEQSGCGILQVQVPTNCSTPSPPASAIPAFIACERPCDVTGVLFHMLGSLLASAQHVAHSRQVQLAHVKGLHVR